MGIESGLALASTVLHMQYQCQTDTAVLQILPTASERSVLSLLTMCLALLAAGTLS